MKTVYFVRHAKSSWDFVDLSDEERPLNKRGLRDAPKMAEFVADKIDCPDALISSPAVRAHNTAKFFASALKLKHIKIDEQLYHASEPDWFFVLKRLKDEYSSVMIFGHNPAITEVVNILSDSNIMNIPTCGVAAVRFQMDSWKNLLESQGELEFYHYPKGI